ncbi:right-handed parallel beta-helix repeat-containing protein [Thalassococcus sp. S3]|uniref:right-handed parallel beta-helix repeat-containing protein n=1 Tax=Thalassococcus sp. S3 TaxID=2017482 RepID=UPI0010246F24|nr:right-handed parallel beta-helix repeat-containing protein [Thalassococcus sp. S3]QBF30867.1 hypothetical protein CFI11_06510 [Thalassococcus sp. S3]
MPKNTRHIAVRCLQALTLAVVSAGAAVASSFEETRDLRTRVAAFSEAVELDVLALKSTRMLADDVGLGGMLGPAGPGTDFTFEKPAFLPDTLIEVQRLDIRLALAMLAQSFGTRDNIDILEAQNEAGRNALVIRKGTANLADLRLFMRHYGLQEDQGEGAFQLEVPLVIWSGAALRIDRGETLQLSRPDGAFILNFGHLQIADATVMASGGENPRNHEFVPFVTTAGGGAAQVSNSRFEGLGFGRTVKFSGFSIVQSGLTVVRQDSFVENSVFERLRSVSISNVRDIRLHNNRFLNPRGAALTVSGARSARVTENLFAGAAPTNAIQMVNGSHDSLVSGNVVLSGDRAGISVKQGSDNVTIAHNIVWDRGGGGIAVSKSDCGYVHNNLVLDNGQKGIEIRSSEGSRVRDNVVIGNHNAAIWVSAQTPDTPTHVADNVLRDNGVGLATATGGLLVIQGNDFTDQFPRFLGGDISRQSHHIAQDLKGVRSLILSPSGPVAAASRQIACGGGDR